MCSALDAMATTSFVGEIDRENGLEGRLMVTGGHAASPAGWTWSVESQAAEITIECSLLYTTDLTPCSCVLRTVCDADGTSILDHS
jgi:hypothetical protein